MNVTETTYRNDFVISPYNKTQLHFINRAI
jgi:hypothetical protein